MATKNRAKAQRHGLVRPDLIRQHVSLIHKAARIAAAPFWLSGDEDLCLTVVRITHKPESKSTIDAAKFAIGNVDAMVDTVTRWAKADGTNVYSAPCIYRTSRLGARQRGGANDIVAMFGLGGDIDADKGRAFDLDHLPLKPSLALCTSTGPSGENYSPVYYFTGRVSVRDATPIAGLLCDVIVDTDGATRDIAHIWRIAGTLNWPNAAKLARGRSPQPQAVGLVLNHSTQDLVRSVDLITTLRAANEPPERTRHPLDIDGTFAVGREVWNNDRREITRLLDAIRAIEQRAAANKANGHPAPAIPGAGWSYDIATYDTWVRIAFALNIFTGGSAAGFDLLRRISAGSEQDGIIGASHRWNEGSALAIWQGMASADARVAKGKKVITVGSIFKLAGLCGFDTRLGRYGLSARPRRTVDVSAKGRIVAEAGLHFDFIRNHKDDFRHEAKEAHLAHAVRQLTSQRALRVLKAISAMIHLGDGTAGPPGCAYFGTSHFQQLDRSRWSHRELWAVVTFLTEAGYIVASPGNEVGAHGRKGASYALTPPPGHTWETLVNEYRQQRGQVRGGQKIDPRPATNPPESRSHQDSTLKPAPPEPRSHDGGTRTTISYSRGGADAGRPPGKTIH